MQTFLWHKEGVLNRKCHGRINHLGVLRKKIITQCSTLLGSSSLEAIRKIGIQEAVDSCMTHALNIMNGPKEKLWFCCS